MIMYCTLDEAKTQIKASKSDDDDTLRLMIMQVTSRINLIQQPRRRRPVFMPYVEQRDLTVTNRIVSGLDNTLNLKDSLLEVTTVLQNTTDITSSVEVYPANPSPYRQLRLTSWGNSWYNNWPSDGPSVIKVTGIWGIHNDYTNAWVKYDDLAADINASITSLTVADSDGADPWGFTPRFSPGSFLRIGTEYILVTAVNNTTNVLTVWRGVNGSTAAAHSSGDDVEVWQIEETIKRACIRQSGLLYARRGSYQVETVDGVGSVSYPQDLLFELQGILNGYVYG